MISSNLQATSWAKTVAQQLARPIFPALPAAIRPYLFAASLFAAATALLSLGDAAILRFGFSWVLFSLLLIVATANLWGSRAAALVLALSAVYGATVVPHIPPAFSQHPPAWPIFLRTLLFAACGLASIFLTSRARRMQGQAEKMQRRAELRQGVVAALRATILPPTLAEAPGYDLSGVYHPLHQEEEVGGDFYDFYPLGNGRYGLLIGDVMGKGKEAAASIALLRYSVRALSSAEASPARVMRQLNCLIETQQVPFETASLFLGFLETGSGWLRYANAGHEPPLLKRADESEEVLNSTGPILGVGLIENYEEATVILARNDALLLVTDGVTEARSEEGEFLDSDGTWLLLRSALRAASSQKSFASNNVLTLLDIALTNYIGSNRCDDVAMLLLRRT